MRGDKMLTAPEKDYKREIRICVDPRIYLIENLGDPYETEKAINKEIDAFFKEYLPHYERIITTNTFFFRFGTNEIDPMKDHSVLRDLLTNDFLGIKSSTCSLDIVDYEEGETYHFLDEQRENYKEFLEVLKDKIGEEPEAFERAASFAREHPFMTKEEANESMSEINFY